MRVTLSQIHKSFGAVQVVKGLDLTIQDGEFLVLLGPSGCGKTTALRMVAGLESVTSGRILIGERDVTNVLPKYRDVAMVFQSYALYPHMTVAENIAYPLKLRKVPPAERDAAVRGAAAKVHLEEFLDRYPRQLSGGQRQRVALARAMVRRPSVFLMDEPLSNLDAKLRGHMRSELKRLQAELGVTTIYVTHDQVEAMTLAHRVAIMNKGVVQQIATPREIYEDPANLFVAGFIGSPPMNFLQGSLSGGTFAFGEGRFAVGVEGDRRNVTAGIRPEDCTVTSPSNGRISARVYSIELMGDHTLVTCQIGQEYLTVKADKLAQYAMDEPIGITFKDAAVFLFDSESGERIRSRARVDAMA
ncbi:ABC transporter ATP-binding protein [Pseudaminobacter sp. 19-2017]|uniref:ABC transporter ATP-binding protein n=1 Tax=Pseudaminobacter soli (ex Zhang et al. 2022) TaxID=2831468 RepID=A0A942I810_9HYPH|nr:ABC transporter ATP-binding protein [Pseudaminobacter soli]MBS3647676.1 ABC transporter ATP-binding protein [Pseudaminobacter soli]